LSEDYPKETIFLLPDIGYCIVLYSNQGNIIFLFSCSVPALLERELKRRGLVQTAKTWRSKHS